MKARKAGKTRKNMKARKARKNIRARKLRRITSLNCSERQNRVFCDTTCLILEGHTWDERKKQSKLQDKKWEQEKGRNCPHRRDICDRIFLYKKWNKHPVKSTYTAFEIRLGTRQLPREICTFSNIRGQIIAEVKLSLQYSCYFLYKLLQKVKKSSFL